MPCQFPLKKGKVNIRRREARQSSHSSAFGLITPFTMVGLKKLLLLLFLVLPAIISLTDGGE